MLTLLKISNGAFSIVPVFAQAITSVTTSDTTFGGFTKLLVNVFWAIMLLVFVAGVVTACFAVAAGMRQQEVPVMLLVTVGVMLGIPALAFIVGNMVGLSKVTSFFN